MGQVCQRLKAIVLCQIRLDIVYDMAEPIDWQTTTVLSSSGWKRGVRAKHMCSQSHAEELTVEAASRATRSRLSFEK